ncbi:hypothetical protein [Cognatishimia activa]|uniref:Uncharacterized protein n=1 Tax=Cognatishimia activa TaxID=1715691 RepID=A0A975I630_9RHOB|nr:hypothetical protein [Cognatishimia activa]QTN34678.1 hypothetical protein HZ995_09155 [Cognatishimia activa]
MTVYLKEVRVPEYCFLSEFVEWVAYGRIPEQIGGGIDGDDEDLDGRFDPLAPDPWACFPESPFENFPSENELELNGIAMRDIYRSISSQIKIPKEHEFYWRRVADGINDEINLRNVQCLNSAWESVFTKMLQREIVIEGISDEALVEVKNLPSLDADNLERLQGYSCICPAFVPLDLKWDENKIKFDTTSFQNLRIKTKHIPLFHRTERKRVSVSRVGENYFGSDVTEDVRPVGRPPACDWAEVQSWLLALVEAGNRPANRKDAVYLTRCYIEETYGATVGATTLHDRMGELFRQIYNPAK